MFINLKTEAEALIDSFHPDMQPAWGMMSAQHVLEHLLFVMEVATGPKRYEVLTPTERIERTQAFLMSEKPMPREFKAPFLPQEGLVPLVYPDLDAAKTALKQGLKDFFAYFEENPDAIIPHPIFGMCNKEQWEMIQRKHFTHHFLQFGLL